MQDHWTAAESLQTALARGDLTAARHAADAIAEVDQIAGLSWDAGPYMMRVRREAQAIATADHFQDAVDATGRLAMACGACHARTEEGPRLPGATTAPAEDGNTETHMLRHTWAMDRMWEGMVVPSEERWRAGARLLGLPAEVTLYAARVHEMGRQALEDGTQEARANRFSRILSDCANCHAELGIQ